MLRNEVLRDDKLWQQLLEKKIVVDAPIEMNLFRAIGMELKRLKIEHDNKKNWDKKDFSMIRNEILQNIGERGGIPPLDDWDKLETKEAQQFVLQAIPYAFPEVLIDVFEVNDWVALLHSIPNQPKESYSKSGASLPNIKHIRLLKIEGNDGKDYYVCLK